MNDRFIRVVGGLLILLGMCFLLAVCEVDPKVALITLGVAMMYFGTMAMISSLSKDKKEE